MANHVAKRDARGLEILARVELIGMLRELLADHAGHRQTQIGIHVDLADGHGRGLTQHLLRHALRARNVAAILVNHLHILRHDGGRAVEHEQDGSLATYAAKVTKAESHVDFSKPVKSVDALIRGLTPDPAAHALFRIGGADPVPVIIEEAVPEAGEETYPAGAIVATRKKLFVACPDGLLRVVRIRPSGKKSMDAVSYINGLRLSLSGPAVIGEALPPQGAAG